MKATIDIPDDLFRQTKAQAALLGTPLKELVAEALREKLVALAQLDSERSGWRSVFGAASADDLDALDEIDEIVADEFSRIDPETWR